MPWRSIAAGHEVRPVDGRDEHAQRERDKPPLDHASMNRDGRCVQLHFRRSGVCPDRVDRVGAGGEGLVVADPWKGGAACLVAGTRAERGAADAPAGGKCSPIAARVGEVDIDSSVLDGKVREINGSGRGERELWLKALVFAAGRGDDCFGSAPASTAVGRAPDEDLVGVSETVGHRDVEGSRASGDRADVGAR